MYFDAKSVEHPDTSPRRGEGMLAVDDLGPMPARKAELERPVVLAERAPGDELEEGFVPETDSQRRLVAGCTRLVLELVAEAGAGIEPR